MKPGDLFVQRFHEEQYIILTQYERIASEGVIMMRTFFDVKNRRFVDTTSSKEHSYDHEFWWVISAE